MAIDNGPPDLDTQPNKHRGKRSIVWEHFTIRNIDAGCMRACCNHCKKSYAYMTGSKSAGTSHLRRHLASGTCLVNLLNQEKNKQTAHTPRMKTAYAASGTNASNPPRKRHSGTPGSESIPFDQDHSRHEVAKMIIQHEYPLHIVEHSGFMDFVWTLQPRFNMVSFNNVQDDCFSVYMREKRGLLNFLGGVPGRMSLSVDLWTSDQRIGYVFLKGHFIDCDWKLHRRILNVVLVPSPDSKVALNHAIATCLADWNFDSRLFTVTLDQSFANDTVRENLRGLLTAKNPLALNGQLLIGSCYARVLSRLAQDAFGSIRETIRKIREIVKYVKTSEDREEKFNELKQHLLVPSLKGLIIDRETKWDTTYHMLVAASELKEVFCCLDASDPNYKETISLGEWKQVETLCTYLKLFFDAADILTATTYPTANTFFHEVWKIQLELMHAASSQDPFISNLIKPLREKFDKYWKNSCVVLAVAVVMDPRFKMKLVEFSFSRIYGKDAETWIKMVDEGVHELFLEYTVLYLPPPTFLEEGNEVLSNKEIPQEGSLLFGGGFSDFDRYITELSNNQQMKSELDQYLEESLLPRSQDFDVLGWWKLNRLKYPALSKMASDILSIPVSTVAPDSVFDTVGKKMDDYRSSLSPTTLEALICAKDWLQYGSSEYYPKVVKTEYL